MAANLLENEGLHNHLFAESRMFKYPSKSLNIYVTFNEECNSWNSLFLNKYVPFIRLFNIFSE